MMPWQGDGGLKPFKLQTFNKPAPGRPKGQPRLLKVNDQSTSGYEYGMKFDGSSLTQSVNDATQSQTMPSGLASRRKKPSKSTMPAVMKQMKNQSISNGFGSRILKGRI
jgi:hypothetical protein